MSKIVAVVGLTGSGKTEIGHIFQQHGYSFIRFGQVVLDEVKRRNLEVNEQNERTVREDLRKQHGMAAMATLLMPRLDEMLHTGNVVADGLYSWSEYKVLKDRYHDNLIVLAVYSSPKTRYDRLVNRKYDPVKDKNMVYRSYTPEVAKSRDYSEIEKIEKAGPIAMADYTLINEGSISELTEKVEALIENLG
jgi:dephospho-CoA kinase